MEQDQKKMMYCIFSKNQNYLYSVDSGSLELSHSFIDHPSSSFSTLRAVSTVTNNSLAYRITHQMQFFNSIHCNADIPLIEPKHINTIDQTHMKPLFFEYLLTILMFF